MDLDRLVYSLCYKAKRVLKKKIPTDPLEPSSYKQALKSREAKDWLEAIYSELNQLLKAGTFEFLPIDRLPKNRKLLTSRFVFRRKKDQKNKVVKHKARLVVRGFL